ncbi:MAG: hypothetical protein LC672_05890, partial [Acidobacteria bacterium]|nr:hypothetical protein [Acidobacteriota bacterium]
ATTLAIRGLRPPDERAAAATEASDAGPNAETITLAPQRLRAGSDAALVVNVALPAGYHLNPYAPQAYRVRVARGAEHLALAAGEARPLARVARDLRLPLRLPLRTLAPGAAELEIRLTLYYCREDNTGTCFIKTLVWRAPVEVTAQADTPSEISATGRVEIQ